ncbi:ribonuclease catalytic domain-containing protein [uncultured Parasutterella sp.]|uniref:ribonuclease catalytic domain-containing protein n=1 Tax=uncultured Parasutterella sp. TaxID=1263098 RepID=UPI0025B4D5A8|nr:ribonuclease catalytic domain-containing protein [uncultured Parasutterella sp.]
MNLFFEEDGAFKVGTEKSSTPSACQVELPTGKRIKAKRSHILITFENPSPTEFLRCAQEEAETIDVDLLWEFSPEGDFTFGAIANEYYGAAPTAVQKAAILLKLHANPVYFYRKGRGSYRKAPEETLRLALAAIERKKEQERVKDEYVREITEEHKAPEAIKAKAIELLTKPDKNSLEWKAVKEASDKISTSPLRMLLNVGAIKNAWHWHVDSFFTVNFPHGKNFPGNLGTPPADVHEELPISDAVAFSIDDSETTEIDDAISVTPLDNGRTRVGIHISAPGLGIIHDSPIDLAARERMSTVYAPGLKTTMLPKNWIEAFTLDEGKASPAVSLYAVVDNETFSVISTETRLERVRVEKNLRYDLIADKVTEETIKSGSLDVPFSSEIIWLWNFAKVLLKNREEVRGRPEPVGRIDWYFSLKGEDENAEIELKGRRRGDPLDLLVAEMMIFANCTWGAWLEERGTAGIYRSQRAGRVKMTSVPGPHDGIGVPYYAWSTSPLRRYVDLINQRQIISTLKGETPALRSNDSELFSIISLFDSNYSAFNDFQSRMSRYWSMRWIEQEGIKEVKASVVKGDLVRVEGLPMAQRVPGLPELPRGQSVLMRVLNLDYVELVMECSLVKVLDETHEDDFDDEIEQEEEAGEKLSADSEEGENQTAAVENQ